MKQLSCICVPVSAGPGAEDECVNIVQSGNQLAAVY